MSSHTRANSFEGSFAALGAELYVLEDGEDGDIGGDEECDGEAQHPFSSCSGDASASLAAGLAVKASRKVNLELRPVPAMPETTAH